MSAPVRTSEVEAHRLPDRSCLLFDKRTRLSIPVSESAGRIWDLCDGCWTVDQIVDDLAETYDAARAQIERDTRAFLALLQQHGFIEGYPSFP
jgi:Coenzyme PQQ synthesis protein D (PqqD)